MCGFKVCDNRQLFAPHPFRWGCQSLDQCLLLVLLFSSPTITNTYKLQLPLHHTHTSMAPIHKSSAPRTSLSGPRYFHNSHTQIFLSSNLSGLTFLNASSNQQAPPQTSTPPPLPKGRETPPKDKHDRADWYMATWTRTTVTTGPEVGV